MNKSTKYKINNIFLYKSKDEEIKNIEDLKKKLLNILSNKLNK